MPRESKNAVKKSVAVDANTYDWIVDYASRRGIDYTAAVNFLLSEAREKIERSDRIEDAREAMYKRADESLMLAGEYPKQEME